MKAGVLGWLAAGMLAGPVLATAAVIVDTGEPTIQDDANMLFLSAFSARGAQFTMASPFQISSIEMFMRVDTGANITVTLRADDAGLPGNELFSSVIAVTADPGRYWRGASGLNWSLGAGTFWATFEARGSGVLARLPISPPSPVIKEAGLSGLGWGERFQDTGWRILGPDVAVPEPGTLALFGLGLAGLGLSRRRRTH